MAFHFPRNPIKSIYGDKYTKDHYLSFVFFTAHSPSFVIPATMPTSHPTAYPFMGPWKITRKLDGASYKIEHCSTKHLDKKHSSALSPYPSEIIPLQPVNGADNQFGELNKTISDSSYIQAGIEGFKPPQPFHISEHYIITTNNDTPFCLPTLEEMNAELLPP